jgi:phenylacetate-CoA ligase
VVLEAVDAAGRPVAPGTRSETVLLTNLANRLQPLIRYDLGDSITCDPNPCPCGSPLPVIAVQGRCDETLHYRTAAGARVALLPLVLTTVLEEEAGVHGFQIESGGAGALRLRLDPAERPSAAKACRALRDYLDLQGLASVRVDWEGEVPIRSPRSGKLRRVQSGRQAVHSGEVFDH